MTKNPDIELAGIMSDCNVEQAKRVYDPENIAPTISAGGGTGSIPKVDMTDPKIIEAGKIGEGYGMNTKVYDTEGIAPVQRAEGHGNETMIDVSEPKINIVGDLHLERISKGGIRNNHSNDVLGVDGISTTIMASAGLGGGHVQKIEVKDDRPIMWPSLNGPTEVEEGDSVVPSRPYSTRKSVMKEGVSFVVAATGIPGVAVPNEDKVDQSESLPEMENGDVCPMLTPGREVKRQNGRRFKDPGEEAFTVTTVDRNGIATKQHDAIRIRYITEREALRLMGQKDDAIDKIFEVEPAKTVRYRLAGNSIVVEVLEAIFKGIYVDKTFKNRPKTLEDFL